VAAGTPEEGETANPAASGQVSLAAPTFWPTLSDDVFDYVLWPSGNDRLWAHGYGDVVDGAFRPEPGARHPRPQTTGSADDAKPTCMHPAGNQTADALLERIAQTIQPTDAQKAALDELRPAVQRAVEIIDAACPAHPALTPTGRLDGMEDRLWAARQALMMLRAPLDKLYGALSDEQKARLNGPVSGPQRTAACSQSGAELPNAVIERVHPSPQQRGALEAVRTTSAGLAKMVGGSCPADMPVTPVARLDAADKRLNTLLYAVVTLRAPVDGFYASLSDPQRMRLSGLGR
jgi:hypothetical protein